VTFARKAAIHFVFLNYASRREQYNILSYGHENAKIRPVFKKNWGPLPLVKRHSFLPLVFYEDMWGVAGIAPPILNLSIKCGRMVSNTHR